MFTSLNSLINSILSLAAAGGMVAGADLPRGAVIETLAAAGDPTETYALYLPSGYDAALPAPVLYLLDARGRALLPVERFREASEATGVILASSYRSRSDEPTDPNLPALRAMWADTHARLRIDDRRVYLGGFSGTARAACLMADLAPGAIAGVIAAGAGFPAGHPPRRDSPFAFFGAVGDADFNYGEMQELDRTLAGLERPYRLEVFEGPHDWMPRDVATAALRWLELRAVLDGRRGASPQLVAAAWDRDVARADGLEASGRAFEARRQWTWIIRDYEDLHAVDAARQRVSSLAKAARAEERDRVAREKREAQRVQEAQRILARAAAPEAEPTPLPRIVAELRIEALRTRAGAEGEDGRAASRFLNAVFVQTAFYLPRDARERGDLERAALFLSVASVVRPEDPQVWYQLAATESRQGHRRQAVDALQRAVEKGFADGARLESDADFDRLRQNPDFRGLAARLGR